MSTVLPVYNRANLEFDYGKGVYLYTKQGEKYLDFAAGIAVNSLGHSHPSAVDALIAQAKKLWHVSNLYKIDGLNDLAQKLVNKSFADKIFFCNSGAEAVECGIKMIRKYHDEVGNPDKYRIITFNGSFHGRTLATISAAGKDKLLDGFEPAVDGFDHVAFNDIEAVKSIIGEHTGGILIEPILGEGGIVPADKKFIQELRTLADENDLLLMFDEVQCGVGRTGKLYAYEWYDVEPDIISSAKGIGNGFPLGACLASDKAAKGMKPGTHGSTYGSNPLAMAVGNAVIDVISEDSFLENVRNVSDYLNKSLEGLQQSFPNLIEEIRGVGLLKGIKFKHDIQPIISNLREEKLLSVPAADNVIRLLPPLIIENKHVDEAIEIIRKVCRDIDV